MDRVLYQQVTLASGGERNETVFKNGKIVAISVSSLLAIGSLVGPSLGCSTPRHQRPSLTTQGASQLIAKHTLFNADWTRDASENIGRIVWPMTTAYNETGESTEYRETIIDRQGRFGFDRDQHYRRFDSIRTGRTYR